MLSLPLELILISESLSCDVPVNKPFMRICQFSPDQQVIKSIHTFSSVSTHQQTVKPLTYNEPKDRSRLANT